MSCDWNDSMPLLQSVQCTKGIGFFHTVCNYIIPCANVQAIWCKLFFSVSSSRKKMKKESRAPSLIFFSQGLELKFYLSLFWQNCTFRKSINLKGVTIHKIVHYKSISNVCDLLLNALHSEVFIDGNCLLIIAVYRQPDIAASLFQCLFLDELEHLGRISFSTMFAGQIELR